MGEIAVHGLKETQQFLNNNQNKHAEVAYQLEDAINNLDKKITNYLVQASSSISESDSAAHSSVVDIVRDIERIGDHFENIVELIEYRITNKVNMTEQAYEDMNEMFNLTIETVSQAIEAFSEMDEEKRCLLLSKKTRSIQWNVNSVKNTFYV